MKAVRQSGKRFLGGVLVSVFLALPALAPVAAHAGSLSPAITHGTTTLNPVPRRCQWIVNEIDNLCPCDFRTPQAYQAALRALLSQLHSCEAQH